MTVLGDVSLSVAQLTAGAFAGVCLYIALVQHPVRTDLPPAAALDDFRAVIPRAERVQAPLLIVGLLAIVVDLVVSWTWPVVAGGLLLLAVLVLTLVRVLPINRRLLSGEPAEHLAHAGRDLARWGRLHTARTVPAVVGAVALWF